MEPSTLHVLGKCFATEQHPNFVCISSVASIHLHACRVAPVQAWGAILEPPDNIRVWQRLPFPLSSVWGIWDPPREEAVRLGSYIQMWRWESGVNSWDLKSTFLLCLFVCFLCVYTYAYLFHLFGCMCECIHVHMDTWIYRFMVDVRNYPPSTSLIPT